MKIAEVRATTFQYSSNSVRDSEGHGHPGPEHAATNTMVTIETDEGARGYAFGVMPADVLERCGERTQKIAEMSVRNTRGTPDIHFPQLAEHQAQEEMKGLVEMMVELTGGA